MTVSGGGLLKEKMNKRTWGLKRKSKVWKTKNHACFLQITSSRRPNFPPHILALLFCAGRTRCLGIRSTLCNAQCSVPIHSIFSWTFLADNIISPRKKSVPLSRCSSVLDARVATTEGVLSVARIF